MAQRRIKRYPNGQCTAKAKTTGERCTQDSALGYKVCRFHGGTTPRGADSPHYKNGQHVRHKQLPPRMVQAYEDSRNDPELLSLRDDIALIDARIADVLTRVDTGEAGRHWTMLFGLVSDMQNAYRTDDRASLAAGLIQLFELVPKARADWAAWDNLTGLIERRRRLVESDARRLKDMHAMISADQAMALMGEIYLILQTHIEDGLILDRIGRDITSRLARPDVIESG